jgi:hypothetical protein
VPLTFAGVVFAVFGFVVGWFAIIVFGTLLRMPLRRVLD